MFFSYSPRYDLALKALCYRRVLPAPGRFPPRTRHGTRSDVSLRVTVLPHTALLSLEHHYTSGHAWIIDDDHPPVDAPLDAILSPDQRAEIAAIQADPARWAPEVLLGLLAPMTDTGPQKVAAAAADFFELGQSVTLDGRYPMLTLRLGRQHDEIVHDLGHRTPGGARQIAHLARLDPPGTPDAQSTIAAHFGADMARAAARFHQTRADRFEDADTRETSASPLPEGRGHL